MSEILISQIDDDIQALRVDYAGRYIQNSSEDWQFLFGPNSVLRPNILILKNAGQFNAVNLDSIKIIGYLYNTSNGTVAAAGSCQFNVYLVSASSWSETLLGSYVSTVLPNNYHYKEISISALLPADLDGDSSLMIECVINRLSDTYRDRIYLNHLGSYDSIVRLRNDVDFLTITKQDI